jgi:hypothetical protein
MMTVRKGDIFYESWGYDQTNIDFCVVEQVSPTGKTVLCRMMSQRIVKTEAFMAEHVVPDKSYGELFRLHVRSRSNGDPSLVGTYPFCQGGTRSGYFSKWEGKPLYQSHYA